MFKGRFSPKHSETSHGFLGGSSTSTPVYDIGSEPDLISMRKVTNVTPTTAVTCLSAEASLVSTASSAGHTPLRTTKIKNRKKIKILANRLFRRLSSLHLSLYRKSVNKSRFELTSNKPAGGLNTLLTFPGDGRRSLTKIPNSTGLKNHGNTCFMNAVLQCLSHTDILAEYLVTDLYSSDLQLHNKVHVGNPNVSNGDITNRLSQLLKSLWLMSYKPQFSEEFHNTVGRFGSQYKGSSQHDAQEFLMFLLDHIHEELNTANKKRLKKMSAVSGESNATHALACHMRSNSSFVYDLFQALYRSSLTCANCHKRSNTFDPFLCVSLPIPQRTLQPVYATLVAHLPPSAGDVTKRQLRIGLAVEPDASIGELRDVFASKLSAPSADQVVLTELLPNGFQRTFSNEQRVSFLNDTEQLFAITLAPSPAPPSSTPVANVQQPQVSTAGGGAGKEAAVSASSVYIRCIVLPLEGCGKPATRFAAPISVTVPKDISYKHLQDEILHRMSYCLLPQLTTQKLSIVFRLRIFDGIENNIYLNPQADHPFLIPAVDEALALVESVGGCPVHLKLGAEWSTQMKTELLDPAECARAPTEDASVRSTHDQTSHPTKVDLADCLRTHTCDEVLTADEAWLCPSCKTKSQHTVKRLSLWSVPDVLVIHLKRFKQSSTGRHKLNTHVEFPITELDMSHHVIHHQSSESSRRYWSSWRRKRHQSITTQTTLVSQENMYDLYAVCNHFGGMMSGHYTAYCKNSVDQEWYCFDDHRVEKIPTEKLVTPNAYLLFYERRSIHHRLRQQPSPSLRGCDQTSQFQTEEHWIFSVKGSEVLFTPTNGGRKETNGKRPSNDSLGTYSKPAPTPEELRRSVAPYATLPRRRSKTPLKNGSSQQSGDSSSGGQAANSSDNLADNGGAAQVVPSASSSHSWHGSMNTLSRPNTPLVVHRDFAPRKTVPDKPLDFANVRYIDMDSPQGSLGPPTSSEPTPVESTTPVVSASASVPAGNSSPAAVKSPPLTYVACHKRTPSAELRHPASTTTTQRNSPPPVKCNGTISHPALTNHVDTKACAGHSRSASKSGFVTACDKEGSSTIAVDQNQASSLDFVPVPIASDNSSSSDLGKNFRADTSPPFSSSPASAKLSDHSASGSNNTLSKRCSSPARCSLGSPAKDTNIGLIDKLVFESLVAKGAIKQPSCASEFVGQRVRNDSTRSGRETSV